MNRLAVLVVLLACSQLLTGCQANGMQEALSLKTESSEATEVEMPAYLGLTSIETQLQETDWSCTTRDESSGFVTSTGVVLDSADFSCINTITGHEVFFYLRVITSGETWEDHVERLSCRRLLEEEAGEGWHDELLVGGNWSAFVRAGRDKMTERALLNPLQESLGGVITRESAIKGCSS